MTDIADPNFQARMEGLASPVQSSNGKPSMEQGTMFSMGKGDGEDSYSKNSALQGHWVEQAVIPSLYEALDHVALHRQDGPILVADLGCSSGPNTIRNVDLIVEKLREKFSQTGPRPEFQAFFNDLPSNDFNNLFKLLSGQVKGNFFATGAPGSFYGRLFPRSSIHVFLSTVAIHYLSKIPSGLVEEDSPASNKGLWRLAPQSSVATGIAYQEQASRDLKTFIEARAAELAPGGLLCFSGTARTSADPNKQSTDDDNRDTPRAIYFSCIDEAWNGLISEGKITEEQSNLINWPQYTRNLEEVRKDVDSYSSEFEVLSVKEVTASIWAEGMDPIKGGVSALKAVMKPFFANHLRDEINESLWQRCEQNVRKRVNISNSKDYERGHIHMYFVALIRKDY